MCLAELSMEKFYNLGASPEVLLDLIWVQGVNNKGAHQTVRISRPVCAFLVHMQQSRFSCVKVISRQQKFLLARKE